MRPFIADILLTVGGSLATSIVAKVTMTMVTALVGVRLARRSRAAVRHALLAAAFAVSLSLPMASILIPSVQPIQVPIMTRRIADSPVLPSLRKFAPTKHSVSNTSGSKATPQSSRIPTSVLLLTVWATGALLALLPMCVGLWRVRMLRRFGMLWQHGQTLVRQLATDAGIHRRVEVLLHEGVSGPVSYGVLRPTIVLPMDAQTWLENDVSRAIIHELEHIRRSDWVSQCLARAVCAIYWFHPLVWFAWHQLTLEAERSCDDAVLRYADPTDYADQLVVLAQRMSTAPNRTLLTMANRRDLATRVAAVLDSRQHRGRVGRLFVVIICGASGLLVATIAPLRISAVGQTLAMTQVFSGSLRDPLGRSLPNTRLTLWNASTQQPIETQSDQVGRFMFTDIPAGEYRLKVQDFGPQDRITLSPGQHIYRDIALTMGEIEDTVTVYNTEAPIALPPTPRPLPQASTTLRPYPDQADLSRCAQASMFCRVLPPIQIASAQPIYPTKERESGVGGSVVVEGRVGTDGLIRSLRALAPANPDFASATFDALRRWEFTPIQLDGVPVDTNIRITAHFVVQ
jgi:TonB family protein